MPEREIPPAPPRLPKVGDFIAFKVPGQTYFRKDVIALVDERSISIEYQPNEPGYQEYRELIESGATEIPERLIKEVSLYAHENNFTLTYLAPPRPRTFMTFSDGYGTGLTQWVFADDSQVRWPSDEEVHAEELRSQFGNARRLVVAAILSKIGKGDGFRDGKKCAACRVCGSWPCKAHDECPNYLHIGDLYKEGSGYRWLPELKRLETPKEIASRLTIGATKIPEPPVQTLADKITEEIEKWAA